MTAARIGQAIFRYGRKSGFLYKAKRYEDKVWKGLYPHKGSRWAVRGSLVAGDVARQLYNQGTTPFESGQTPTNNPYKKGNSRFNTSRGSRRRKKYCRCGDSRKRLYRRSRYR